MPRRRPCPAIKNVSKRNVAALDALSLPKATRTGAWSAGHSFLLTARP